jgi:hypothetical protein
MARLSDIAALPLRVARKIEVDDRGCWLWCGAIDRYGYGVVRLGPETAGAHRATYELLIGPIPDGLQIDHLCRVRRCVNPQHLETVTQRENLHRGDTVNVRYASRTHCPKGHPFDEANTYVRSTGARRCRACMNEYHRLRYQRRSST